MQHVLSRDSLGTNSTLGKCHILRNRRIEMMAHHCHVEVFVERVHGEGVGWIGRRRQAIHFASNADDVGCMAAAGAFRVIHMNGTAADSLQRVLDEAGFV